MIVKEDQIDSANIGGLNALVFDEENQERRSWKFLKSQLPRSEVVYFSQILITLSYRSVFNQACVFPT